MQFDEVFIEKIIPGASFIGSMSGLLGDVVIDSRLAKKNDLFIALPGTKHDGHQFIEDALENGAQAIMMAQDKKAILKNISPVLLKKVAIILVPETLPALTMLATAWREQFNIPVVGITGSVGKTTTKTIVAQIMKQAKRNYLIAYGNQNTEIGVSLNLLRLRPEHEGAVFEMGISRSGEMAKLVSIVKPTTGVITNIGNSHLEGIGSLSDVSSEKRALFSLFKETNIGIINGDQPVVSRVSYPHPVIRFGLKIGNQLQARKIQQNGRTLSFMLKIYESKFSIIVDDIPEAWVSNMLAAAAVAHLLEIPHETIAQALSSATPSPQRFFYHTLKKYKGAVVDDSYNANPESMRAALHTFEKLPANGKKIAVLGDMLELGAESAMWHRQLGRFLSKVPSLRTVILVGSMVQWIKKTAPVHLEIIHVATWQEALPILQEQMKEEVLILVKGSRSMQLDQMVTQLIDA